ncbi:pLS20_p028 family conjugation system transmembrane protein [Shouchella sp. 1P09AA]|uniref:pLS20_p028 family conjugation system transmembrane protein n=1 Tax=unclassified Shouchella TaxID=2893065 RepID=UPI0039A3C22D
MSEEEILEYLDQFSEHLNVGTLFIDMFRTIGWWLLQGMAWIVDSVENITDSILGIKTFFENPEVADFINQTQPFLYILIAINIGFIGFLIIFKRDSFNRSSLFANIFMALVVIVLLSGGMQQANDFTDDAINAINYGDEAGSLADEVIVNNITDVVVFDMEGWSNPDLEETNNLRPEYARNITINAPMVEGEDLGGGEELSSDGEDILSSKIITLGDGSRATEDLQDGGWITDITQEYYYRYDVDWINALGTLGVIMVVLVTIAVKLARMFFELGFNYIIAPFVAASDLHSGQRIKQVIQNILNLFLVTIMIFLSLKVYMIGASWLGEELSGIPYLIAMIGFGIALMNGPNMIERLFGIDGGSKQGWGAMVAGVAGAKGLASMGMKGASLAKSVGQKSLSGATKSTSGIAGALSGGLGKGQGDGQGNSQNIAKLAEGQNKLGKGQGNGNQEGNGLQNNGDGIQRGNGIQNGSGISQGNGSESENENANQEGNITRQNDEGQNTNSNQKPTNQDGNGGSGRPQSLHQQMKAKEEEKGKGNSENQRGQMQNVTGGKGNNQTSGMKDQVASVSEQAQNEVASTTDAGGANNTTGGEINSSSESSGVTSTNVTGGTTANSNTSPDHQPNTQSVSQGKSVTPATPKSSSNQMSKGETRSVQKQQVQQDASPQKEVVDLETEVISNSGNVQQEVRETTTHRSSGSGNVQTTNTGGASGSTSSESGRTSAQTSASAPTGGNTSGSQGGSSTTESTTQKTTTNVSGGEHTHKQVVREENEVVSDERHVGQVIKDTVSNRFNNSNVVKDAKQSYNIGKNTGSSLRKGFKRKNK